MEFKISSAIHNAHTAATQLAVESVALAQDGAESGKARSQLIREDTRLLRIGHGERITPRGKNPQTVEIRRIV
jgi:hypothetical protein